MRPINVTLDSQTWEWAKKKTNFSQWVRNKLRLEQEMSDIKRNDTWLIGKCHCGVLKNRQAPSWCTNHEVHEVKE